MEVMKVDEGDPEMTRGPRILEKGLASPAPQSDRDAEGDITGFTGLCFHGAHVDLAS